MAITIPSGFKITAKESVDNRILLTKAEMAALSKATMPDKYFCICKDDGKLYMWDANREATTEMGRFVSYEEVMDVSDAVNKAVADPTSKAKLETSLSAALPQSLKKSLDSQTADTGLNVDTVGNITINTLTEEEIHSVID